MYEVTIQHPAIDERQFTCEGNGDLLALVYGVHVAQGEPVADDKQTMAAVDVVRLQADAGETATLNAHKATITVDAYDDLDYACEGHEGEDAVLLGGPSTCDGSCKPRKRFDRAALVDLASALDDAELDATGGCGACGLEAGQMCAACGRCNCERHDRCKRPADS
ncbi:hypothetical protein [Streptomyces sp. NPDC053560]|uniref:hypothetical protein n=1 Tax=Streptomyces sp. NPDC053560 TaxID=3365711 RepID=UPI0037D239D3